MKIRSLALTAVTAGALGMAGCGSDNGAQLGNAGNGSGEGLDAQQLLAKTFQPSSTSKIKSGQIDLKADGSMSGKTSGSGSATATIKLNQAKSGEIPEFSADVAVKGEQSGGKKIDFKAGGTYTGNRFYVSYDGENYDVGEELSSRAVSSLKAAIKQSGGSTTDQSALISKLGLQPQTWLTDPKIDGTEKIGGTDTYKITGAVDVKALVPDVLDAAKKAQSLAPSAAGAAKIPEISDAELDQVSKQIKKLDVTIWTGKDDTILRKLAIDASVDAGADGKLDGSLELTLTNVNEKQDISAPSDTKPITDLMPKLSGLFGAAAGTTGLGGATTGTSSSSSSAVSEAYVKCVNEAGGDAAKLNACQAVLTSK